MDNRDEFEKWWNHNPKEVVNVQQCNAARAGFKAACELKDKDIEFLTKAVEIANNDSEYFRKENEKLLAEIAETNSAAESACAKLESYQQLFDEASAAVEENRNLRSELDALKCDLQSEFILRESADKEINSLHFSLVACKESHAHNLAMHEITLQQRDAARSELDELNSQEPVVWSLEIYTGGSPKWVVSYTEFEPAYITRQCRNKHPLYARPVPAIPESASQAIGIVPVPEGYVLVPVDPTVGMIGIGACVRDDSLGIGEFDTVKSIYKAMIAASQKEVKP